MGGEERIVSRRLCTRRDLGLVFADMGFEVGAEIGVARGDFSLDILERWKGKLYCVDSWEHVPGYRDVMNYSSEQMKRVFEEARRRLEPKGAVLLKMSSLEAAARFQNTSLDWAYLDADHRRKSVEADLEAWWPKVRSGGMMAGHDYKDDLNNSNGEFGVKGAVDEFFGKLGIAVKTTEESDWKSWYVLKP